MKNMSLSRSNGTKIVACLSDAILGVIMKNHTNIPSLHMGYQKHFMQT